MKKVDWIKSGCTDVKDENGNTMGFVCVYPSKDLGKRDIIFYNDKERRAKSVRSITELMNVIASKRAPKSEIIRVTHFVGERLRELEREKILKELTTPIIKGKTKEERE